MATTSDIRNGVVIYYKGKRWKVVEFQHVKPGKGGAFVRTKLKELRSGKIVDETFNAGARIELIKVEAKSMQYLYLDDMSIYFMDNQTYEQIEIGTDIISENQEKLLIENETVIIQMYELNPISIVLPDTVTLEVIEADAVVKGQTAASSYKPAVLERKIKTSVPPFIEVGDKIVISTRDTSYVEKAKN